MPRFSDEERRTRLARRHHLSARAMSLETVADALVGFHATDPASVYLSAWARVRGLTHSAVEAALYEERSLAKVLGMRRTMFVVTPELAGVIDAACTQALFAAERKKLIKLLEGHGVAPDGGAWIDEVSGRVLHLLDERGELTAVQIGKLIPELTTTVRLGAGTKWEADVGVSSRVLFLMSTALQIVRGRPLGTWLSSQYRWAATRDWLGELESIPPAQARASLVRRYLAAFGPATRADVAWWTGWTLTQTDISLAAAGAVPVQLTSGIGVVLPGDLEDDEPVEPWVALLPALDPTVMGWKERDWYLGPHKQALFDANGNAGPTVWCNGRIVGGWGQDGSAAVVCELFEDVPQQMHALVHAEAMRLTAWLGGTRVTPRFRTSLERTLAART